MPFCCITKMILYSLLKLQLLESVWFFLKGNISFAFNLVTTVLSIVFFSGAYLLNTGLSMVSRTYRVHVSDLISLQIICHIICSFIFISAEHSQVILNTDNLLLIITCKCTCMCISLQVPNHTNTNIYYSGETCTVG